MESLLLDLDFFKVICKAVCVKDVMILECSAGYISIVKASYGRTEGACICGQKCCYFCENNLRPCTFYLFKTMIFGGRLGSHCRVKISHWKTFILFLKSCFLKFMAQLLCKHLATLLILNCLDFAAWRIFGPQRLMLVYLCEQLFKVILRTAMFSMLNDYNIILLKKVLNVYYKNNFRKKKKNLIC